ncbi:TonB-linked SusC/RagA family outer membrane protein [Bacteroides heparinolyticus]|uniref:TonB-linked SusC/RagA family outer membrane protein n=6 Tax=Prevotella heparinolytica TaxID=28113 RepID=A0A4V2SF03_9BACE|nr:TonB-dependent receptor [Bacteroides heparinolyticus]TCO94964.1 TonB-linked SusC/RagA family outer membrane protein [Bacteroides heparinolyticus]
MKNATECSFKRMSLWVFLLLTASSLLGQTLITVKGTVTDAQGEILIGVTVLVQGTQNGTVTNADGHYTIQNVPINSILDFSYVGMRMQSVEVNRNSVINVILKEDSEMLENVVVIGYGEQKRDQVVSSISAIEGKRLELPARNLTNNIAGRIPGLLAIQRSGEPGYDNAEIWIRGISSFSGGTGALVLVDGVPRHIQDISPEEIESFTILKDASATAVYGAEGANGVILITSKRGKIQKTNIELRADCFVNQPTRVVEFVDSKDWLTLYNEAAWNTAGNPDKRFWNIAGNYAPPYSDEIINRYITNADPDIYPNTRWMDLLKPVALNQRLALNFRGGGEKVRFFVAASFFNEEGLFKSKPTSDVTEFEKKDQYNVNIGLQRYNLRTNIDFDIAKWTKLRVDLSGQYLTTNYPGTSTKDIFNAMMRSAPHLIPMLYSNGYPSRYSATGGFENPYTLLNFKGYTREYRVGLQTNVGIEQRLNFITPGLYIKGNVSFDADFIARISRARKPNEFYQSGRDDDGNLLLKKVVNGQSTATEAKDGSFNGGNKRIYLEASLNYNRTFAKRHAVNALLLYMQKESQIQGNPYPYKKQSFVGRAGYAFDNKYYINLSFGFTGSENFAPNHRYGFFPAMGLGYQLTNERKIGPWLRKQGVSNLKLRLSYGLTGNDQVASSRFPYKESLTWSNERVFLGMSSAGGLNQSERLIYEKQAYNPQIRWEIEEKRNIGLDIGLLDDAFSLTLEYFNNLRHDILLQRNTVSQVSGLINNPFQNFGKVRNYGFESSLNFSKTWQKWQIGAMGTFTFARNKIIEMDEVPRKYAYQMTTGSKIGQIDAWVAERLYIDNDFDITENPVTGVKTYTLKDGIPVSKYGAVYPGNIKYVDMNNDGIIDEFDWVRTPKGTFPEKPEIVYGFGFSASYGGVYLSTFFQGMANRSVYLQPSEMLPFLGQEPLTTSVKQFALSRWQSDNPSQQVVLPRLMLGNMSENDNRRSTWWLRDGSFLRFKNLEVGYRFNRSFLERIGMRALRIYLLCQNICTWDHIKYWDPEMGNSSSGMGYPIQRSFNLGVDITF